MTTPSPPRLAARVCAVLALSAAVAAPAVAGEPAMLRLDGSGPSYGSVVDVPLPGGGSSPLVPGRNQYTLARASGTARTTGFAVDPLGALPVGVDYPVDLQTAFDDPAMWTEPYREAGWLLYRSDDLLAASADPGREAGALHLAILQLTGQSPLAPGAIGHPDLEARADALRDLAAGRRLPTAVGLDAGGPDACPGQDLTVRVTGSPGALVDLSVPPGSGAVSPPRVSLDDAGTAEAQVRPSAPGILSVSAAMSTPLLQRATRLPGWSAPQSQLLLRSGLLTVRAERRVVRCRLGLLDPPPAETPGGGAGTPARPPAPSPETRPDSPKLGMRVERPPHGEGRRDPGLADHDHQPRRAGRPERGGRSAPGRRRGGARRLRAPGNGLDRARGLRPLAPDDGSRPLGGGPRPSGAGLAAGERREEHDHHPPGRRGRARALRRHVRGAPGGGGRMTPGDGPVVTRRAVGPPRGRPGPMARADRRAFCNCRPQGTTATTSPSRPRRRETR